MMYTTFFIPYLTCLYNLVTNQPYMFRNCPLSCLQKLENFQVPVVMNIYFLYQTSYSTEVISQNLLWKQFSWVS